MTHPRFVNPFMTVKLPLIRFDPHIIMYLILPDKLAGDRIDVLRAKPSEKFFNMVREQVSAYMDGKAVPAQITPALMNIGDDVAAGREISLKAGDYISLMDYARSQKIV